MDTAERAALIERYLSGPAAVFAALEGAGDEEPDRSTSDGWTARQIVHHLADSETNSYIRIRQLLAEESPTITGYDEELWAAQLHYERPIDASLAVFAAVRNSSAELLACVRDEDWARAGTHTQSGPYTLEDWLRIYAAHAHDHADQIRRSRSEPAGPPFTPRGSR